MAMVAEGIMPDSSAERLASLPKLSKTDLHNLWKELFQKAASPNLRKDLMTLILRRRLQEQRCRSLSLDARRRLAVIARTVEANPNAEFISSQSIKAVTRLVRRWQDKVHVVHVEDEGYDYEGSRYESLSEIARLITGTR